MSRNLAMWMFVVATAMLVTFDVIVFFSLKNTEVGVVILIAVFINLMFIVAMAVMRQPAPPPTPQDELIPRKKLIADEPSPDETLHYLN